MVAQIMGTTESVTDQAAAPNPSAGGAAPPPQEIAAQPAQPEVVLQPVRLAEQDPATAQESANSADVGRVQPEPSPAAPQHAVRRHGTAKPVV
jgi:hypothetical protein